MSHPLRTCGNCDGDGGYEVAYRGRPPPWGDGADGGEWIDCSYCGGSGWEEGEPEPIEQDELPPPRSERGWITERNDE